MKTIFTKYGYSISSTILIVMMAIVTIPLLRCLEAYFGYLWGYITYIALMFILWHIIYWFASTLNPNKYKKARYFIVSGDYNNQGKLSHFSVDVRSNGNKFLNKEEFITHLENDNNINNVVITNIIEISEEDYIFFNS